MSQNTKRKELVCKLLSCIPAILMMAVIFYFSSRTAGQSSKQSQAVVQSISGWNQILLFFGVSPEDLPNAIVAVEIFVRKLGHIIEFLLLTVFVLIPHVKWCSGWIRRYAVAALFSLCYAISDEVHQIFVDGRGPSATDVLIDSIGIFLALMVFYFFEKRRKKRKIIKDKEGKSS